MALSSSESFRLLFVSRESPSASSFPLSLPSVGLASHCPGSLHFSFLFLLFFFGSECTVFLSISSCEAFCFRVCLLLFFYFSISLFLPLPDVTPAPFSFIHHLFRSLSLSLCRLLLLLLLLPESCLRFFFFRSLSPFVSSD